MSKVALLNMDGQPLQLISKEKAALLLYKGVATPCEHHGIAKVFRSISTEIIVTKAIRLVKFIKWIYEDTKKVVWSKRNVLARDKHKCQYCGTKADTIDHVTPKSKGGRNGWLNTVAACKPCNTKKDNKTPEQAGMTLRKKPYQPTLFQIISGNMTEEMS